MLVWLLFLLFIKEKYKDELRGGLGAYKCPFDSWFWVVWEFFVKKSVQTSWDLRCESDKSNHKLIQKMSAKENDTVVYIIYCFQCSFLSFLYFIMDKGNKLKFFETEPHLYDFPATFV